MTPSKDAAAQVAAVQHGRADAIIAAGLSTVQLPVDQARALLLADASHLYTGPTLFTHYLFLNVHERPFDDWRVRRALNYAIDRRRMVELAGGSGLAGLSCQVIPPGLPGYAPTCPFTRRRHARGHLGGAGSRARSPADRGVRLARSARAGVGMAALPARHPLRRQCPAPPGLSRADPEWCPTSRATSHYVNDTRNHVQVGFYGWIADFLSPATFFDPFTCVHLTRNSQR